MSVTRLEVVFEDGVRAVSCNELQPESCNGCSFNTVNDRQPRCHQLSDFGLNCSVQEIIWKVVQ